jgi:hypothetical protein
MLGVGLGLNAATRRGIAPVLSVTSGGGYAGSVYKSSVAGQWTADGAAISGQTGTTYTMTVANEGKAIRCGASNAIEMWTLNDIPRESRTNGGWWDPKISETTIGTKVTSWPDQWGVRDMTQALSSSQPTASTIGGYAAAVWPDTDNNVFLTPPDSFTPAWVMIVAQYKDGADSAFDSYESLVAGLATGSGNTVYIRGDAGKNYLRADGYAAQTTTRKNGGADGSVILPLSKSLLGFTMAGFSDYYGLGRSNNSTVNRGWKGPIFEAVFLGFVPDTTLRQKIEGCMAWRNGTQSNLPTGHPFYAAAPRIS